MEITHLGHSSFRIKGKDTAIVTDPFDPDMLGARFPKVSADIVTVSHDHKDHNRADLVQDVRKVINGPGEYEISGTSIIGIPSYHDDKGGAQRGKNTIYIIEMDGIRLAHLGDLGHELKEKDVGQFGQIDVLFIPTGGVYTIGPKEAYNSTQEIEPKVIIPMHFKTSEVSGESFASLSGIDEFISQDGFKVEKVDKLKLKKEDLIEGQQVLYIFTQ